MNIKSKIFCEYFINNAPRPNTPRPHPPPRKKQTPSKLPPPCSKLLKPFIKSPSLYNSSPTKTQKYKCPTSQICASSSPL